VIYIPPAPSTSTSTPTPRTRPPDLLHQPHLQELRLNDLEQIEDAPNMTEVVLTAALVAKYIERQRRRWRDNIVENLKLPLAHAGSLSEGRGWVRVTDS